MKSRIWALLIVIILALGLVSVASAQDDMTCMGLSSDDCAILQAADANSANIKSFTTNFQFNLTVGGLESVQPGMGEVNIRADGSGPIVMDESKMTADDPTAGLGMAMTINGSTSGTGEDASGSISFVIADGNFYLQNPATGEWEGTALSGVMDELGSSGLPLSPDMLSGEAASAATDPTAMLSQLGLAEEDVMKIVQTPGFLVQERLADESMMGQNMYPFAFTIDFVPLFSSADFQQLLTTLSQSSSDPSMAQVGMMGQMLPMLVKEGSIKMTRWVGADDQFIHRFALDINANVDVSMLAGSTGDSSAAPTGPITLKMSLVVDLTDINNTAAPAAPEGAKIVPVDEFGASLGG